MLSKVIEILNKRKKNIILIIIYIFIIFILSLVIKNVNYFEDLFQKDSNVVREISVTIIKTRVEIKEEEDVMGNLHKAEYDVICFNLPDNGEYKEMSIDALSEDEKIKKGDRIIVYTIDGGEYTYGGYDRKYDIAILTVAFIVVTILIGGILGIKSLFSLVLSFLVLIYGVVPLLIKGYDPILIILTAGVIILALSLFILYGIHNATFLAFVGTLIGLIISLLLSIVFINILKLSGLSNELSIYVNSNFNVDIDMKNLLIGAFILGTIGIVDDVSMSQVVIVKELIKTNKRLFPSKLYKKAMNVGKSHIASMINTLFMVYFAVSLPMILVFLMSNLSFFEIINKEFIITEIVRTLIGSIALILSVPITTYLASRFLLKGNVLDKLKKDINFKK